MRSMWFCILLMSLVAAAPMQKQNKPPSSPYDRLKTNIDAMIAKKGGEKTKEPGRSGVIKTLACFLAEAIVGPKSPFKQDGPGWRFRLYIASTLFEILSGKTLPVINAETLWKSMPRNVEFSESSLGGDALRLMSDVTQVPAYACMSHIDPSIMGSETYQIRLSKPLEQAENAGLDIESKFATIAKSIDGLHETHLVKFFLEKVKDILRSMLSES